MESEFSIVYWSEGKAAPTTHGGTKRNWGFGIARLDCPIGSSVYTIEGDKQLLFAAQECSSNVDNGQNSFHGMIYRTDASDVIGHLPSTLFTGAFCRRLKEARRFRQTEVLKFRTFTSTGS